MHRKLCDSIIRRSAGYKLIITARRLYIARSGKMSFSRSVRLSVCLLQCCFALLFVLQPPSCLINALNTSDCVETLDCGYAVLVSRDLTVNAHCCHMGTAVKHRMPDRRPG